jgi:hypothetical protein
MDEVLAQIERELVPAIRLRVARRARRRRVAIGAALALALPAAVAGASAVTGEGPLADVLGVERDDPTLRSVVERRGAPRGVVRVRGGDRHSYTFVAFHAKPRYRGSGPGVCFTHTRDDAERIPSLGCAPPAFIARQLRDAGIAAAGPAWAGAEYGGLRVTKVSTGLVPAAARRVSYRLEGGEAVEAKLSRPFPVSLRGHTSPARMRAFIAVASRDADGAEWLGGPLRETTTVFLADGSTRRSQFDDPAFFPMTHSVRPGSTRMVMRLPAEPAPWRSVGYLARATPGVCGAAAPVGYGLIRAALLQCSSPLAVINSLHRYGAALYFSNPNPRRERGPRSMAVFGYTPATAGEITLVNQLGRRYEAKLSSPWAVLARERRDLTGLDGALLERLRRLPRRMRIRSFITSIRLPPRPTSGRGLTLEVRLRGGRLLRTDARGPVSR